MRKLIVITLSILCSCKKSTNPTTPPPNNTDTTHNNSTNNTLDSGLIAYYSFSGNANDSINGLNGIVHGATLTKDRFGNNNSAYYFNGYPTYADTVSTNPWNEILLDSSTYIEIPDNPLLHFSSNNKMSISLWSKITPTARTMANLTYAYNTQLIAISKTDSFTSNQAGYEIGMLGHSIDYQNSYGVFTSFNLMALITNNNTLTSSTPTVNYVNNNSIDSNWHHYVFTFNNGLAKTYMDGVIVDSSISSTSLKDNNNSLLFGKCNPDTRFNIEVYQNTIMYNYISGFTGDLDDIKIYNRDINITEVNTLYHQSN